MEEEGRQELGETAYPGQGMIMNDSNVYVDVLTVLPTNNTFGTYLLLNVKSVFSRVASF